MSEERYQWQKLLTSSASRNISDFKPEFGVRVNSRYSTGKAKDVELQIYTQDFRDNLFVIGPFNNWGRDKNMEPYKLGQVNEGFQIVSFSKGEFQHKTPYLLIDNGVVKRDPGSLYFDEMGNSVFWDFEDRAAYQQKHNRPDRVNRAVKIIQSDLPGLITHYCDKKKKKLGHEIPKEGYYRFIADCGVIPRLAELGFNAIQFLPVSQAIDGDKWSFRYLIPFLYAINKLWGNPDDFAYMIDKFHEHGISVILDHVISHAPDRKFRLFDIPNRKIGIHRWVGSSGEPLFLGEDTSWGTKRYQYHNNVTRRFLAQSAVSYLKNYKIDGFRIDNVDGILRHGENGDGPERHGGRELMRELASEVYAYDPHSYLHLESHYFHGDNAKLLVQDLEGDERALGATAYTSSRLTHFLHQEYMPKPSDKFTPWDVKNIIAEKEWGRSNSTVADYHNHDAAAGLMAMRATGSYAYDALILKNPEIHHHAVGKIKVMEALISFGMEGRNLDLLQSVLLQTGTFEHDSSVHWWLDHTEVSRAMLEYKKAVNKIMDAKAFWPLNVENRNYLNIDDKSKTLTIHRTDGEEDYLIIINMASHLLFDFVIPSPVKGSYSPVLNSDQLMYAGTGRAYLPTEIATEPTNLFEFHKYGIRLGSLPGYTTIVLKLIS